MNLSRRRRSTRHSRPRLGRRALVAVASVGLAVATLAAAASLNLGFADTADLDRPANHYPCGYGTLDPPCPGAPVYNSEQAQYGASRPHVGAQKSSDPQCASSRGSSQELVTDTDGNGRPYTDANGRPYSVLAWSNCDSAATTFVVRYPDGHFPSKWECVPAHTDKVVEVYPSDVSSRPYIDTATLSQISSYGC